jgi:hypothetical protein
MGEAIGDGPPQPGPGGGAEVSPIPDAGTPKALPDSGLENPGMDAGPSHDGGRPDAGGRDAGQGTPTPDAGSPRDAGSPGDAGSTDGGCAGKFCDDFEASTAGQAPRAPWTLDVSAPQDGKVVIDSTMNHTPNGGHSLKVSVAANPSPANSVWAFAELRGAPALPLTTMYGRMWVRYDQLASNNGNYFHLNNVEASGLLSDNSTTATDIIGMYYYLGTNTMVGYTTANANGSAGLDEGYGYNAGSMPYLAPATNSWICYEWMFGPPDLMNVWINGTLEIQVDHAALIADNRPDFPAPIQFTTLEVGWAQWHNSTVATNMWIDDFVIGPTRIGCQ